MVVVLVVVLVVVYLLNIVWNLTGVASVFFSVCPLCCVLLLRVFRNNPPGQAAQGQHKRQRELAVGSKAAQSPT